MHTSEFLEPEALHRVRARRLPVRHSPNTTPNIIQLYNNIRLLLYPCIHTLRTLKPLRISVVFNWIRPDPTPEIGSLLGIRRRRSICLGSHPELLIQLFLIILEKSILVELQFPLQVTMNFAGARMNLALKKCDDVHIPIRTKSIRSFQPRPLLDILQITPLVSVNQAQVLTPLLDARLNPTLPPRILVHLTFTTFPVFHHSQSLHRHIHSSIQQPLGLGDIICGHNIMHKAVDQR